MGGWLGAGACAEDTFNWKLASIGVAPIVAGLSLYGWLYERQQHDDQHHHPFQKPKYVYLRTATKKWPWQNIECTFWDMVWRCARPHTFGLPRAAPCSRASSCRTRV